MTDLLQIEPSRTEIWKMFDAISKTYDKTNRLMTFGLDLYWRGKMTSLLPKGRGLCLLDCATGTADQIISLMKSTDRIDKAFGIDLSEEMLEIGRAKIKKKPFQSQVHLQNASALALPFSDETFDCVTLSFGIRNVTDVDLCLREIVRVLKPGGRALILETSLPKARLLKTFHLFYIRKILPLLGGWISKKKQAYTYLNKTAETFPSGKNFCNLMEQAGFESVQCNPMTFGVVSIYLADKPLC